MNCDNALAERLIQITSQPITDYIQTMHDASYHAMLRGDDYASHEYIWTISRRKKLVVSTSESALVATNDQHVTGMRVVYYFAGFKVWVNYLDLKLFPASVIETIRQFAMDGTTELKIKSEAAKKAALCEETLQILS